MSDAGSPVVRACTPDDLAAVLALARDDEERVARRPSRLGEGDVRDWWQTVDLAANSWLLTSPQTQAVLGAAWLDVPDKDLGLTFPIASRHQLVPVLIDLVERRAAELGVERLQAVVLVPDPPAAQLLADRGYVEVRRFFEMAIELDGPPPAVRLPDRFTLHVATPDDGPAFHAAMMEAFEDHWEHHPRPFEEWWQIRTSDPEFDIAWWFLIRSGDETVATIRNVPGRNGGVYVATLGVRRDWRGLGLAKALLRHTFARSYEAGFRRVTLGVDASSPTGATALYRSVGMTTELESAVWERSLARR
jgi:ribosomal protein S18 acetylase RimI-like enzyme